LIDKVEFNQLVKLSVQSSLFQGAGSNIQDSWLKAFESVEERKKILLLGCFEMPNQYWLPRGSGQAAVLFILSQL
jgi:hypothetical protein